MNRKTFIKNSLTGAFLTPLIISAKSILNINNNYPRMGYLSINNLFAKTGEHHGEWSVIDLNTGKSPIDKYGRAFIIEGADDIEGYIEVIEMDEHNHPTITHDSKKGFCLKKGRIHGNYKFVYRGKNPKYSLFKK